MVMESLDNGISTPEDATVNGDQALCYDNTTGRCGGGHA